jgi:capsular polysaccharide biosynthesis protein
VTLKESLRAIVRGWKVVVLAGLLGFLVAGLMAWRTDAEYVSNARLFVAAASDSKDPEELFQRNMIATQRLASYVELVSSDALAAEVAKILGEDADSPSLESSVTASTVPDTVIIDLEVTRPTPEDARRVAEAYSIAVPKVISQVEKIGDQDAAQVSVTPIVSARPGVSTKQGTLVQAVLGALLAMLVGAGVMVIRASLHRGRNAAAARPTPDAD